MTATSSERAGGPEPAGRPAGAAGALVAGLTLAGCGSQVAGGSSGGPPVLRIGTGYAAAAAPMAGSAQDPYPLDGTLPTGPASATVLRYDERPLPAADVEALATALGVTGTPVRHEHGWRSRRGPAPFASATAVRRGRGRAAARSARRTPSTSTTRAAPRSRAAARSPPPRRASAEPRRPGPSRPRQPSPPHDRCSPRSGSPTPPPACSPGRARGPSSSTRSSGASRPPACRPSVDVGPAGAIGATGVALDPDRR